MVLFQNLDNSYIQNLREDESLVKVDTELTILENKKGTTIFTYQEIYEYITTTRIKLFKVMETNF